MIEQDAFAAGHPRGGFRRGAGDALIAADQADGVRTHTDSNRPEYEWWICTGTAIAMGDPTWARRVAAVQHGAGCPIAKLVYAGLVVAITEPEPAVRHLVARYGHGDDPATTARQIAQDIPNRFPL